MPQPVYVSNIHADLAPRIVLDRLRRDGWEPIPISEPAGYLYPPHSHAATKLLAILSGSMECASPARHIGACQAIRS